MDISTLLDRSTIAKGLEVADKKELINSVVDLLEPKVNKEQLEKIRQSVFDREEIMSTGVGKQLAIPHGKCDSISETLASFAVLDESVEFDSIDNLPVKMVFLLVGPEDRSNQHIKLLSRISRLMNSSTFRNKLLECENPDEIFETFKTEEKEYFGN
ncbi:PTS sugar transporter subunit IIA [Rhodohalobacter sp. 8-1]|uniref:PTS sugar transporter subunit IIA n=1 Tax=Rhodohalobacter sp. 8-1 TaxID=3131972 RepID=UPI0030EE0084